MYIKTQFLKSFNIVDLTSKTKQRRSIPLALKLEIIDKLENGYVNAQICREYGLSNSTVSNIWTNKLKFLGAQTSTNLSRKKMRGPNRKDVDDALLEWVNVKRNEGVTISVCMLQEQATHFARQFAAQEETSDSMINPVYTKSWVHRFKKRHQLM